MTKSIPALLQIRWLSALGATPVPRGIVQGEMEMLDLASGMQFCRVAHRFSRGGGTGLRAMSEVVSYT